VRGGVFLALVLTFILVGMLNLGFKVQVVKAVPDLVYIKADGSISPPSAPIYSADNVTYTLTGNLSSSIIIERDNILLNGADFYVQGTGVSGSIGIDLSYRTNVTVKKVSINTFWYGIYLIHSSNNSIIESNIESTNFGIYLYEFDSNYNKVLVNNITNNAVGIYVEGMDNVIYHNNFVGNAEQFNVLGSSNTWDDGYPSGGNYWSNYNGSDLKSGSAQDLNGSDAIGDVSYTLDNSNEDRYPLMGRMYIFDVGTWDSTSHQVQVINYPFGHVDYFELDAPKKLILLNLTAYTYTMGFCRLTIPTAIVDDMWPAGDYTMLIDGELRGYSNWTDAENTYLFAFTYFWRSNRLHLVVIPEFASVLTLSLFMMSMLFALIIYKRRYTSLL